jgi:hypothetical protein
MVFSDLVLSQIRGKTFSPRSILLASSVVIGFALDQGARRATQNGLAGRMNIGESIAADATKDVPSI